MQAINQFTSLFEIKQREKLVKMIYLRVMPVIKNLSTSTETILIPMIRLFEWHCTRWKKKKAKAKTENNQHDIYWDELQTGLSSWVFLFYCLFNIYYFII